MVCVIPCKTNAEDERDEQDECNGSCGRTEAFQQGTWKRRRGQRKLPSAMAQSNSTMGSIGWR